MKKYNSYKQKLKDNYFLEFVYFWNENYNKYPHKINKFDYLKQGFYYQIYSDKVYKIKSVKYVKYMENKIKEFCN